MTKYSLEGVEEEDVRSEFVLCACPGKTKASMASGHHHLSTVRWKHMLHTKMIGNNLTLML